MRKNCAAFRLTTTEQLQRHVSFDTIQDKILIYRISDCMEFCDYEKIEVYLNPFQEKMTLHLPEMLCILDEKGLCQKSADEIILDSYALLVMVK